MADQVQQAPEPPAIPGYEFIRLIGEGGMAAVWAARQLALDRLVAVKIFRLSGQTESEWVARFKEEAKIAARLVHPGIVQVYDAGESGDVLYYVMELVEGCTAAELIEMKGRILERHALAIALGVAEALRYAWEKASIIHCDVKPANILIDREGVVRVSDLGLSRTARSRPLAEEPEISGTPNYASPEQAAGEEKLDFRSDIYSLGATLYHMVTGKLPFGEYPPLEVLRCQQEGFLPDPIELCPDLSPATAWLIEKMMMRSRDARYGSWTAVVEDIEAVRESGTLKSALPPPGGSTVLRSGRRALPQARPKPEQAAPQRAASETSAGERRRVVLPRELRQRQVLKEKASELHSASYPMMRFMLVLVVAVTAYGVLGYMTTRAVYERKTAGAPAAVPGRAQPVERVKWEEKPIARIETQPAPLEEEPRAAPVRRQQPLGWRDPRFLAAARAFNHAYAEFVKYGAERGSPRQLQRIEEEVRQAIRSFEECRAEAPPEVDIGELIDRCYHLLADIRQAMLSAPLPKEAPTPAERRRAATPPLPSQPKLALQAGWDRIGPARSQIIDDLYELIFEHGTPSADRAAPRGLVLFDEITYLMPAGEALSILGSRSARKKPVTSQAFPPNSFYYYEVEGDFGEGFTTLLLVTDIRDQVVAVQLVDNTTRQ